jgi:CrcB protein
VLGLQVALAAGVGAVLRYLVDLTVQARVRSGFPWGTLVVNLTGSFALGLVAAAVTGRSATVLGTGFCGGYTTLSTLTWESLALAEDGAPGAALLNVLGSTALGLLAGALGLALG